MMVLGFAGVGFMAYRRRSLLPRSPRPDCHRRTQEARLRTTFLFVLSLRSTRFRTSRPRIPQALEPNDRVTGVCQYCHSQPLTRTIIGGASQLLCTLAPSSSYPGVTSNDAIPLSRLLSNGALLRHLAWGCSLLS